MPKVTIVLNRKGVAELLKDEIEPDISARAERIAAAAGRGYEAETDILGPNRVRAEVHTVEGDFETMASEMKHHWLLRSIDAGRG